MSTALLSVLSNKENYDRFARFVKPELLPPEIRIIFNDIKDYYKGNPHETDIDWVAFGEWFKIVQHPTYTREKHETYDKLFDRLIEYEGTDLEETIIEKYILQDTCQQIADLALRGAEGDAIDIADIEAAITYYSDQIGRVSQLESFIVTDDLDEILEDVVTQGYEWRMQFLNQAIGNIRKGKLICFAARPSVGKTTWLASQVTYLASQLEEDECILWFNNEEAGKDVKLRLVQAALQVEEEAIRLNPKKALDDYKKAINGPPSKIKLIDKADINTKDVEEFVKNHNVKAVVFDQLWKVHGFEKTAATDTARLGSIYQWARELGKKNEIAVITVHQVKTEGEGVEYLTPNLLYLSGTVIQGEVDSLILMGRNFKEGQELNRYISIGKNKGAYGPHVDPLLAEGKTAIMISPRTAEFLEP